MDIEPRHTCLGCGGSCHGVVVRLASDEQARVATQAAELGVDAPIVDGALRQEGGRCVFLDAHERCRIHATWGAAAKPRICSQYPRVRLETPGGGREGVDPGCYTALRTDTSGELAAFEGLAMSRAALADPREDQVEGMLLALVAEATVPEILGRLAAPGIHERWLRRLQEPRLRELVCQPAAGAHLRSAVLPVLERAAELEEPPDAPLPDALDRWTVEVTRRMVYLRLCPRLPVPAVALLTILGATACGWTTHEPDRFGASLAGWTRAMRAGPFVAALAPDAATFARLVTGR